MNSKEEEYRQLFLTEALENFEELNRLFVELEKDHSSKRAIANIFRIVHTLKGNAMGMGYDKIADLSHTVEDIFGAIKNGDIPLDTELVNSLFRANDKLGGLINAITTNEKVSYLGIKTKLSVFLKNALEDAGKPSDDSDEPQEPEIDTDQPQEEVKEEGGSIKFADVVQIPVKRMDDLLNMVGELVIERDRLISLFGEEGKSTLEFERLKRISSNLHYGIMNVRMVQMGFLFNKFHRVLRDAAATEKKSVELVLKGTEVEIDRNILKIISDSMVHLVRNAVSHGIESSEERKNSGKDLKASVTLSATLEKDSVVITISDDGKGIDKEKIKEKIVKKKMVSQEVADKLSENEIIRYIFEPGFSSAEKITEISGRGVGMDVVKKAVESIGGQVLVETEIGIGTSVHLVLPSSLALKGALLFIVDDQEYAIPLTYIDSVTYLTKDNIHHVADNLMIDYNDKSVPIVFLKGLLNIRNLNDFEQHAIGQQPLQKIANDSQLNVVIASHSGRLLGLVVDRLDRQKEIIEKKLPKPLNNSRLLSGSTILGSGNVCPVLDVASIMDILFQSATKTTQS
ncbi:two-component system, chemotaxis family, sensor kinase CheA [Ekhidna lutea]|uniref:Chemotaxis protein CheA n=1 Tax=Ekhidna lutea TaxID=447679 RepID=A0A239H1A4_EKHLU|nr:chemotaxis protein CheA [Ekhidna lutea]SNS75167.1 two-component system, chemotaxis family, sensor kinase CheA [Ekhidna lutea]